MAINNAIENTRLNYTAKTTVVGGNLGSTVFKYKFICVLYAQAVLGSNIIATLKVPAYVDSGNVLSGTFDVARIVQANLKPTHEEQNEEKYFISFVGNSDSHATNLETPISKSTDTAIKLIARFGEEYSATSIGTVVEYMDSGTYDITSGVFDYVVPINYNFTQSKVNEFEYSPTFAYPTAPNRETRFLSVVPVDTNGDYPQYVSKYDWGTLSILCNAEATVFNTADIQHMNIILYNKAGSSIDTYSLDFDDANSGGDSGADSTSRSEYIQHIGVCPQNIWHWLPNTEYEFKNNLMDDDETAGTWSYRIFLSVASGSAQCSAFYDFIIKHADCVHEMTRLCWRNKLGCWDYFNFYQKSTTSITTQRKNIRLNFGTWADTSGYTYKDYDRGGKTLRVDAERQHVINTGFIDERYNEMLEDLFVSNDVFVIASGESTAQLKTPPFDTEEDESAYATPIQLTGSSFARKTKKNNKLINYTITYKKSHKIQTHWN